MNILSMLKEFIQSEFFSIFDFKCSFGFWTVLLGHEIVGPLVERTPAAAEWQQSESNSEIMNEQ